MNRLWLALPLLLAASGGGCLDVREFSGVWAGPQVGSDPVLRVGFGPDSSATLVIEEVRLDDIRARFSSSGDEFRDALIQPLPAAEADVLGQMTFAGSPARVFLSFASPTNSSGDALVIAALYSDPRVEIRVLRGGPVPLYGIFDLRRQ
jgi:hypothetical protein